MMGLMKEPLLTEIAEIRQSELGVGRSVLAIKSEKLWKKTTGGSLTPADALVL
jgi:hypothetical protein